MDISNRDQLIQNNHIPVFGIESKSKSEAKSKSSQVKSKKVSTNQNESLAADSSSELMRFQVAETAYYKAEARGFETGHELEDWLAAEAEVIK